MGDGMPGSTSKGKVLVLLDTFLNIEKDHAMLLDRLRNATDLGKMLTEGGRTPIEMRQHFEDHVLGTTEGIAFWPNISRAKKNAVILSAYEKALRLVNAAPAGSRPQIQSYWVCPSAKEGTFEATIFEAENQITIIWITEPISGKKFRGNPVVSRFDSVYQVVTDERAEAVMEEARLIREDGRVRRAEDDEKEKWAAREEPGHQSGTKIVQPKLI